ncbi:hypothetical protein HDU93_000767 [Gonapodya sp. JEL0774]|nr:hypothetical protein HDU93_000767 [Gonapodya sp. JEL0774]
MADRKNVNKYYPPGWDPSKGSINTYVGSHPLRERAKRLKTEGILVIRFEMPYNIWCGGCGNHIGMGVRYNAQKKKVGNYFSTPILQFRMKCHLCDNWIEITTDPKNAEYVVTAGARRKNEEYTAEDAEVLNLVSEEQRKKLATDPMYRLEHEQKDKKKVDDLRPVIEQLQDISDITWSDPYTLNSRLRRAHRAQRHLDAAMQKEAHAVADRLNLSIPVLPVDERDEVSAKRAVALEGLGKGGQAKVTVEDLEEGKKKVVDGEIFGSGVRGRASISHPTGFYRTSSSPSSTPAGVLPNPSSVPPLAKDSVPSVASLPVRSSAVKPSSNRTTSSFTRRAAKEQATRSHLASLVAQAKRGKDGASMAGFGLGIGGSAGKSGFGMGLDLGLTVRKRKVREEDEGNGLSASGAVAVTSGLVIAQQSSIIRKPSPPALIASGSTSTALPLSTTPSPSSQPREPVSPISSTFPISDPMWPLSAVLQTHGAEGGEDDNIDETPVSVGSVVLGLSYDSGSDGED